MKTNKVYRVSTASLPTQNTLLKAQIKINKRSVKKAIEFIKQLFSSDIPSKNIFFDKLGGSFRREPEPDMDLKKFIELLEKNKSKIDTIGLQIGNPDPHKIVFVASFEDEQSTIRFAWLNCVYNSPNLQVINHIFKGVFGKDLS